MTELAAVSRDEFDPVRGLPSKRFGLYRKSEEGKPDAPEGRFDSYYELIAQCDEQSRQRYFVDVAHYTFLSLDEFADLFGPLPHLRT